MDRTSTTPLSLPLLLASAALLGACGAPGAPVTQPRGVEAFHSITLRGAAEVEVTLGEPSSLVLQGTPGALERLESRVQNGRLVLETRGAWWWQPGRGPLRIRATLPHLNAFELAGAGRVNLAGLDGGATSLVLSGAGEVTGSGRLDALALHVNGAGRVDLAQVRVGDAEVTVNGAGEANVHVTGRLRAVVNGVGNIRYLGMPAQLETSLNGVGSIGPR